MMPSRKAQALGHFEKARRESSLKEVGEVDILMFASVVQTRNQESSKQMSKKV